MMALVALILLVAVLTLVVTPTFKGGPLTCYLGISNREVIVSRATREQLGLGAWPDGAIGVL